MSKHTSAKVITNGEDNKLFSLDNRGLLRELESCINRRKRIHLATRNFLDYAGGAGDTISGVNSIRWDDVDDNVPMRLKIFYKVNSSTKNFRGGGNRASKSGFQESDISSGCTAGFGDF